MQISSIIADANRAIEKGDEVSAMLLFKQAGELGDISAALDYAYFNMHSAPQEVIDYLYRIPAASNSTVQFHQLLIGYFNQCFTDVHDVAKRLVALAKRGNSQASLVALSYLSTGSKPFSMVSSWLKAVSPNICEQLGIHQWCCKAYSDCSDSDIVDAVTVGLGKDTFSTDVVDELLPVTQYFDVLSEFECAYFVTRFSALLRPSMVVDPQTGEGKYDQIRTSYVAPITANHCDWHVRKVDRLIATISQTRESHGEYLNLLRYSPGQEYKGHYDAIQVDADCAIYNDGGQRCQTALIYLNTVNDGGRTTFPKLGKSIKPQAGSVLIFTNVDKNNNVLLKSYHAGETTVSSNKWLLTKWIREMPTTYGKLVHNN